MNRHLEISSFLLFNKIKDKKITLGGNERLKIYGTLNCSSGKRMKKENRVFFSTEEEALQNGYRPCGNCMRSKYNDWKQDQ
jgi:methylphosphotriester-DNA--protein-cysteine methyltransferase